MVNAQCSLELARSLYICRVSIVHRTYFVMSVVSKKINLDQDNVP